MRTGHGLTAGASSYRARGGGGGGGRARALGFSDAEIAGCVERELGRGAEDSRAEF